MISRTLLATTTAAALTLAALAQVPTPTWWQEVLNPNDTPDDYAALNQGQLKNLARAAFGEMQAKLPGGAGTEITALIDSWQTPGPDTDDYQVVTVGQLKNLAALFFARLESVRAQLSPGWAPVQTSWPAQPVINEGNAELANVGQAKHAFHGLDGNRTSLNNVSFYNPVTGQRYSRESGRSASGEPFLFGLSWLTDTDGDGINDFIEIVQDLEPLSPEKDARHQND